MAQPRSSDSDTEKLRRRNQELVILNAIAEALNRPVELEASLRTALAQVAELLDLRTGWIFLLDEETGEPHLAAAQNLPPGLLENPDYMEGSCHCLDTFRCGDLSGAANVNVVKCSRLGWLAERGTEGLRYHASIPLYASGHKLGVLNVASTDWRKLSPDDLRLLYTVGDLLSIAIERARLFARTARFGALEERNRLAREIHDTLAQALTGIALQLETADALLEAGAAPDRIARPVRQALELTRASLEEARRSVLDLRAAPLEGRNLAEALAALTAATALAHGIDVRFEPGPSAPTLPARLEVGLYRIAQEALTNVVRHSQARQATVSLGMSLEQVRLTVEDDGRGFDPALVGSERFGLIGLNERARLLGGALSLETCTGKGTRLEVVVPMHISK